jgi:hypothetical protein
MKLVYKVRNPATSNTESQVGMLLLKPSTSGVVITVTNPRIIAIMKAQDLSLLPKYAERNNNTPNKALNGMPNCASPWNP